MDTVDSYSLFQSKQFGHFHFASLLNGREGLGEGKKGVNLKKRRVNSFLHE